jgi:hypothetical protein
MPLKCKNSFVNTHFLIENRDIVAHFSKLQIHFSNEMTEVLLFSLVFVVFLVVFEEFLNIYYLT